MLKLAAALFIASASASAAAEWRVTPLDASIYADAMPESGAKAPDGLPDGLVAYAKGDVRAAWYVSPTRRYAHAILGDAIEAAALRVQTADGGQLTYDLPANMVYEDRTPRIADLDGDGRNEVVTIRSELSEGGGVARLTTVATRKLIAMPTMPMPSGLMPNHHCSGPASLATNLK